MELALLAVRRLGEAQAATVPLKSAAFYRTFLILTPNAVFAPAGL
jgi:hypothetical protein